MAVEAVFDQAVAARAVAGQPRGQLVVDQRSADGAAKLLAAVVRQSRLTLDLKRLRRQARDHVNGTGSRVLAIERALRAAQHLDSLEVDQVEYRIAGTPGVNAVDEQADAAFNAVVLAAAAQAADRERRQPRIDRDHGQARHPLRQVGDRAQSGSRQVVTRQRHQRDRHVERTFLAVTRCDDHGR